MIQNYCRVCIVAIFLAGYGAVPLRGLAEALPDDPALAWAQVNKLHFGMYAAEEKQKHPTPEQVADQQKKVRQAAAELKTAALEFLKRFPTHERASEARKVVASSLKHAAKAGDEQALRQKDEFVASVLADQSIPEEDRVRLCLFADGVKAAIAQFPSSPIPYTHMVADAEDAKGERQKELAREIVNAPAAPPSVKALAKHLLEGTKPYEVGKPLDLHFTALDGREVDLSKMKGKVVLVEFWATGCGPCVVEMPKVKALYEKLHERGFEVVGISSDEKEKVLRRFVKEKGVPWPQYFDGNGPENPTLRYGIFAIPQMWLVDKSGNLRDTEAREDLEKRVVALLEEK